MAASLNTARALFDAQNHEGARREIRKVLKDDPENVSARVLASDIEMDAGNYNAVLDLCKHVLAQHPGEVTARSNEILALLRMNNIRAARKKIKSFETDLPFYQGQIQQLKFALDAKRGRRRRAHSALKKISFNDLADGKRSAAIVYHKLGDLYRADALMRECAEEHCDDYEFLAAAAINCLMLCKLSLARRFARRALAVEPRHLNMRLLIIASYLFYFPPFCLLTLMLAVFEICRVKTHRFVAAIVCVVLFFLFFEIGGLFYQIIGVLAGVQSSQISGFGFVIWFATYFSITCWDGKSVFRRKIKPVKLKKF